MKRPAPRSAFPAARPLLVVTMAGLVACGGTPAGTTAAAPASTAPPPPITTTAPPTTTVPPTTTTASPSALEQLGYPVSNEWVVETITSGIEAATGGLAVGPDGTMYQADFGTRTRQGDTVFRVAPDGTVEPFVQTEDFQQLTMTTFGPDGLLYQSDYAGDRVYRIALDGTYELVAEGIDGPTGIVFLNDGDMLVESYNFSIVYRVTVDGTVTEFTRDRGFNGINGMAMGPDGTLYIVNHRDGGLFSMDQAGTVTELHMFPAETSHVAYLDGSLFVTSRGAFVVYRYDLATGDVEIIAGNAEPGDQDGRGGEASFGRPNAITVGPDGALYINHGGATSNSPVTIRRIVHDPK